ncbi:flagellar biosynthesis anti-sigma factor FlgM [Entomospira culicis]|uniref:Flagellar biosynthesis anti-sigma factor FlgM n=1 Tax=Entomospira culicis TaxID=2719989 RepID=A0A968GEM9_9SPIO|nr:flagellar biosynthesis anti-sigma factor FlgM [Entomospira culicis]NIZ18422.1 flagellar biosynthesis anti-sigma factor FlgM [Entomospira culicis]NIZ68638.1 flagellar biosynthesis anti-sigma factor FlgM [Entomospira culicis]WDI37238.1 flagellar biosynthesis anti-sigma factor FlgM [Entomospira culicis]WDI38866.1 flagellar biosynthesis anti-sigma factor FlgM [Entomospira culicis]
MNINRINPLDPLFSVKKPEAMGRVERSERGQSIQVSSDAQLAHERLYALEAVRRAPDVRADEIVRVQAAIADPNYLNDKIEALADRLLDAWNW